MNLRIQLKSSLKGAGKLAVLGVGSELRGDDAAGLLFARCLQESLRSNRRISRKVKVFLGYTAPENLTGEIKRFGPSCLLIVDSADLRKKAGTLALIESCDIRGVSFSTHALPLSIMADYLLKSFSCKVLFLVIQPKALDFGSSISLAVKKNVQKAASAAKNIILKSGKA
ncbi:MAG: hydrogenase 3 maturation endopeptidase HyCI [Candidatus Omnitrophota bacterium]